MPNASATQSRFEDALRAHLDDTRGTDVPGVRVVRAGMDIAVLDEIRSALGLVEADIERLLHVSARTLQRRRREGGRLSPAESDRLWRLQHALRLAARALGDAGAARAWLREPKAILDGETPIQRLDTEPGLREVEDMLGVIDEGMAA